jgi:5-methylcytosine-specific restriction endonuclease McrA
MPAPITPSNKEKKAFLTAYKLERGCAVCGYNKCSQALEFDHIDRTKKNFQMAQAFRHPWTKIQKELQNCVVLCANCHREKTVREKDYVDVNFEEPEDLQLDLL